MAKMHQVQLDENNQKVINLISLPEGAEIVPSDAHPLAPGDAEAGISPQYSRGDHRHPAQVISKGNITKGGEGDITVTTIGLDTKININFPDAGETYAAHSESEEESEELKELMPDGGIIIRREGDANPVLEQVVNDQLVSTQLRGIQAVHTEDEDETNAILDDVDEGCLFIEGTGPLVVQSVPVLSEEQGNALEVKADGLYAPSIDDSNLVHKTGNETISGIKYNTGQYGCAGGVPFRAVNENVELGVAPESVSITYPIRADDKNGKRFGVIQSRYTTGKTTEMNLFAFNAAGQSSAIGVHVEDDGTPHTYANTPVANSNNTEIATTKWVRDNIDANVVHKTGYEEITGEKKFSNRLVHDSRNWMLFVNSELDQAAEEISKFGFVIDALDNKGVENATIFSEVNKNATALILRTGAGSDQAFIAVRSVIGGEKVGIAPTPPDNSNTNHIATTAWVRSQTLAPVTTEITDWFDNINGRVYMTRCGKMVCIQCCLVSLTDFTGTTLIRRAKQIPPLPTVQFAAQALEAGGISMGTIWVDLDTRYMAIRQAANGAGSATLTYFTNE